ncbi:maleylpyruvate isomerase family mycothiol-dependent enzyme [Streptomyces sp. NPDC048106]|uniref:maleylpyruvate isomerase family mycothiol-dependent enzyme n=1 Tax=Streptomyces sp. NPDC048106 TaxID=3155750 RepID=UPI003453C466
MTYLDHERYCDEIALQVGQLRELATSGADLSANVPTCPEWSLEQLVRHMGGVLRWVGTMVREQVQEMLPRDQVPLVGGPEEQGDPAALDAWLAETGELAVGALREAGPELKVWTWTDEGSSGFWARRMAHEITIHRADAALTVGAPFDVAPDIAADALDEWLDLVRWVQRTGARDWAANLRGSHRSIHLHATDADPALNAEWLVEIGEDGVTWRRGHEKAMVALRGPLTSVLLAFYGRIPPATPGLEVLGEREALEFWLEHSDFG